MKTVRLLLLLVTCALPVLATAKNTYLIQSCQNLITEIDKIRYYYLDHDEDYCAYLLEDANTGVYGAKERLRLEDKSPIPQAKQIIHQLEIASYWLEEAQKNRCKQQWALAKANAHANKLIVEVKSRR
jgi:hypothetical protein